MELYCVLCGGRIYSENSHLVCLGCDAEYSNVLLSESAVEDEEKVITEMSLGMDFVLVKHKPEKSLVLELENRTVQDRTVEKEILVEVM